MRGNSDRDALYPFTVAPRNGWGHDNPTGEFIIADARQPGKGVAVDGDEFKIVTYENCTPFSTAAEAAVKALNILFKVKADFAAAGAEDGEGADQYKAAA